MSYCEHAIMLCKNELRAGIEWAPYVCRIFDLRPTLTKQPRITVVPCLFRECLMCDSPHICLLHPSDESPLQGASSAALCLPFVFWVSLGAEASLCYQSLDPDGRGQHPL